MRCADETIVEIFEWVSQDAIEGAHKNPVVLDLWKKFEALCWYETPANLPEFQNMFGHFEPIHRSGRMTCVENVNTQSKINVRRKTP